MIVVGLIALSGMVAHPLPSAWGQGTPIESPQAAKLHFRLRNLLQKNAPVAPEDTGLVRIDERHRVQVYIRAEPATPALRERIAALGGTIEGEGLGVIQAWVPVGALMELAALPEVRYIRPPDYGHPGTGAVDTQGDAILMASAVRQQFGVDGTGVRVGVISSGIGGLAQSIATGDLPPTTFYCQSAAGVTQRQTGCLAGEILVQTTGGITGTPFPAGNDLAGTALGPAGAEGTAMLEIVHDLAPGAQLWFANVMTGVDFINAWSYLAQNVDVVVSDVVLYGFFTDGQNALSQAIAGIVANPTNRARAHIQGAGNFADSHYAGLFTDSGVDSKVLCDPFNDCTSGRFHLFTANGQTTGPGPSIGNEFTVPPNQTVTVALSWNDPAGASTNNYDLVLYDCPSGLVYQIGNEVQNGAQDPQEIAGVVNPNPFPIQVCYAIVNVGNLAAPRTLNVILAVRHTGLGAACGLAPAQHLFNTASMSLVAPADTTGDLITTGAVPACAPNQIEGFSSRGPTFDGRTKPDMVAVDGVSWSGAGGFSNPFYGTSATGPHVGGIAALLLQLNPGLTRSQLKAVLQQSASPLGDANTYGAGLVNAAAAANVALGAPLVAAILPASRSVQVGVPATAFVTILNAGGTAANGVGIGLATSIPAAFKYNATSCATNAIIGGDNAPVNIPAGGQACYVVVLTPTAPFNPTNVAFTFAGANTLPPSTLVSINTLLLSASSGPVPDIVALAATPSNDGIADISTATGSGVCAVATVNVGASGLVTVSTDTGSANLPLSVSLCQTNPNTGQCLSGAQASLPVQINAGQTPTFAFFLSAAGPIPLDAANNRIFVRFKDGNGVTRGSTSVAVRTQ
jgi:hypothetical protein